MNYFEKYLELLVQLHKELRHDRGDDEFADQLRDQMDEPASKLTEYQFKDVEYLSELLYNLADLGLSDEHIKNAVDPIHSFLLSKTYENETTS